MPRDKPPPPPSLSWEDLPSGGCTATLDGLTITITPDSDPESPRSWSNLCTMRCWHRHYHLGDPLTTGRNPTYPRAPYSHRDFLLSLLDGPGHDDLSNAELLTCVHKLYLIAPLHLYDHSGLRMKIGSFRGLLPEGHAECDSGQVGWIYVSRAAALKEWKRKRWTPAFEAKILALMEGEVETYDQYLRGDVWSFTIEDPSGSHLESCSGLYTLSYCQEEAISLAYS